MQWACRVRIICILRSIYSVIGAEVITVPLRKRRVRHSRSACNSGECITVFLSPEYVTSNLFRACFSAWLPMTD